MPRILTLRVSLNEDAVTTRDALVAADPASLTCKLVVLLVGQSDPSEIVFRPKVSRQALGFAAVVCRRQK